MYLLRTIFECCLRCVGGRSSAGENKNSNDRPYSAAAVTTDNERDETRRPNVECVGGYFKIMETAFLNTSFPREGCLSIKVEAFLETSNEMLWYLCRIRATSLELIRARPDARPCAS